MIEFLSAQGDDFLEKIDAEGHTNKYYLEGIINHNRYHLGQIGLVLSLVKNKVCGGLPVRTNVF